MTSPEPGSSETLRLGTYGAVLLLVGGLLVSPLPASCWLDQLAARDSVTGRMIGIVAVGVGLAVMAAAWVRLWRAAGAGLVDLAVVRRATAAWCAPLVLAPPLFSRDGWSYAAQGELTRLGLSPYVWGPGILHGPIVEAVDPRWMTTPTPYGPLPLLWGAGAAAIVEDPWLLVVAHRLLALVGLLLLAWALPRLAGWTGREPVLVSAVVLPSPLVLAHGVGGLHNDLVMVGLAAAALVVAAERGWLPGAVVGGLAAAVKVPGGLVCVGVALVTLPVAATWSARLRRLAGVGAVSVATLVGTGYVSRVGTGWVAALGVPTQIDTPLSVTTQLGRLVPGVEVVGAALVVATACWTALWWPTGTTAGGLHAATCALTVTVLLSPVVQPWYFLWCVPLLAACALGPGSRAVLTWVTLALGVSAPLGSSLQGRPVATVVTTALVLGALVVLARSIRQPVRQPVRQSAPSDHLEAPRAAAW